MATAFITGAGVRIGSAVARALGRAGYDLALHANRSVEPLEALAEELRALGRQVSVYAADLSLPQAVDALGRGYFRPNIAISITQGVLHRTLFTVVAMLVGRERAPALYDALTCFCETKTNLVNGDLYRLYRTVRDEPELERLLVSTDRRELWEMGMLERFPGFAAAFGRFLENHGHRDCHRNGHRNGRRSLASQPLAHADARGGGVDRGRSRPVRLGSADERRVEPP